MTVPQCQSFMPGVFLIMLEALGHYVGGSSPSSEKSSIQIQQIPDKSNDREPLLFTYSANPVLEPLPVKGNDLEYESNTFCIKASVHVRGDRVGMRKPGTAHAAGQGDNKDETVCTTDNNCGPHPPLLMPF